MRDIFWDKLPYGFLAPLGILVYGNNNHFCQSGDIKNAPRGLQGGSYAPYMKPCIKYERKWKTTVFILGNNMRTNIDENTIQPVMKSREIGQS